MAPQIKLYGPKQIALIVGASAIGIGFYLFRRYYEYGKLGKIDLIASLFTVAMVATITTVMVRKGNRED